MSGDTLRRVAFVTGASSGIGRAAATAFVQRGYATALVDFNEAGGRDLEAKLREKGECRFFRCDVSNDDSVRSAVEQTVATYGRLDAAFNAAGIDGEWGGILDCTPENWHRVIAVDLTGIWSCMRHQIPEMVKSGGGAIVNCASTAGLRGAAIVPAYTAAKHGVVGLTKAAALEWAGKGILINAICPGSVDTPQIRNAMPESRLEQLKATIPAGRLADPAEIADIVLWLCDERPGFIIGQTIGVDGGMTAR
jgi:NAD(P)-dependent dehydrogenase (short-subunit alcohol dehydrogenase family)